MSVCMDAPMNDIDPWVVGLVDDLDEEDAGGALDDSDVVGCVEDGDISLLDLFSWSFMNFFFMLSSVGLEKSEK